MMPRPPTQVRGMPAEASKAQLDRPTVPGETHGGLVDIALLVPPGHGRVPEESQLICPPKVRFEALGLALDSLVLDAYATAAERALAVAARLAERPPAALSLMGTSLSFFGGRVVEQQLRRDLGELARCPATTMASAVLRALGVLGCRRPAVVTAYTKPVDDALRGFLVAHGIRPGVVTGLDITDVLAVEAVPTSTLVAAAHVALSGTPGADSILISCGGLRTLDAVATLESELGIPVVSSSLAGPWDVLGLAGYAPKAPCTSQLLATTWADFQSGSG